jgi:hypothetical protein
MLLHSCAQVLPHIYGKIGEPMYCDYVLILLYMLNLRRKLFCHGKCCILLPSLRKNRPPRRSLPRGDTGGAQAQRHRPLSVSSPSLAVAGGLRRAKPGRSGGGRALLPSSAGGLAGEQGISSAAPVRLLHRRPSGLYDVLVDGWRAP